MSSLIDYTYKVYCLLHEVVRINANIYLVIQFIYPIGDVVEAATAALPSFDHVVAVKFIFVDALFSL